MRCFMQNYNGGNKMICNGPMGPIGIAFFIIFFLLVVINLVLVGIALWKYITKN